MKHVRVRTDAPSYELKGLSLEALKARAEQLLERIDAARHEPDDGG